MGRMSCITTFHVDRISAGRRAGPKFFHTTDRAICGSRVITRIFRHTCSFSVRLLTVAYTRCWEVLYYAMLIVGLCLKTDAQICHVAWDGHNVGVRHFISKAPIRYLVKDPVFSVWARHGKRKTIRRLFNTSKPPAPTRCNGGRATLKNAPCHVCHDTAVSNSRVCFRGPERYASQTRCLVEEDGLVAYSFLQAKITTTYLFRCELDLPSHCGPCEMT